MNVAGKLFIRLVHSNFIYFCCQCILLAEFDSKISGLDSWLNALGLLFIYEQKTDLLGFISHFHFSDPRPY